MELKGRYKNVSQMVRETTDKAFADEFDRRLHRHRIVKDLMVLRAAHGLSQTDVAEKMGCTQSRISKLESSEDLNLTLGDLAGYASAVGFRVGVLVATRETTAVERVKLHAFQIKHELARIVELVKGDQKLAQAAAGFINEAFFNLVKILQDSAEKLPCDPNDGEPLISFEIIQGEPDRQTSELNARPEPSKTPRKRRKGEPVEA
jgi:transcriptional regulator with XRE-family HTH domain